MAFYNTTITATGNSDNRTISEPNTTDTWIYTWDGLGGTDTLSFDRLPRSQFTIFSNSTGIHVNSVSGASHKIFSTLNNVESLKFSDGGTVVNLVTLFPDMFSGADTTAPTVNSFSPTDAASGVAVSSNIVLTFNETIARGTGNIEIRSGSAGGTLVESFNAASSDLLTFSGSTLTINPTASLANSTQYFVVFASGAVKDTAGNSYLGTSTYDFTTAAPADTTAPTVSSFSPTDAAINVAITDNVVLTFSETIARGTGTIEIRSGSATGTLVESFNAASSSRLTFSGSTLTINPTNSLANSTQYFVVIASGAVKDTAGNSYLGTSTYDFTTVALSDTTAPTVITFSPADAETVVAVGNNIVLTFSETVVKGTGNILIRSVSATGTIFETFDAATSSRLTFDGNTLTIDPTNNLAGNTNYFVTFAAGTVKDTAGNSYGGISTYDFTTAESDTTAPTVSSFSPADATTGVAVSNNIVLTFSEAVVKGTGNILIRSVSATGTIFETFDAATSSRLTFSGNTLTIDPTNNLAGNTKYFVTFAAGTVKDAAGNSYAGISTYDFTTAVPDTTAPTVTAFSPADATTGVAVSNNIVLTFSEAVVKGTGNILIRSVSATGTIFETFDAATSSRLTFSGNTLTIDPTNNLAGTTKYFVTFAAGTVKDLAGNSYAGISTYDFTTAAAPITGTSGNDTVTGTTGIDTLYGLAGNDVLSGLAGLDVMNGGEGSDIYLMALSTAHPGAEINDSGLSGTDEVRYSATSGTLTLYAGDLGLETVVLGTGTGAAAVVTGTSAVSVNASAVTNALTLTGNNGINTLTGTNYADTLIGNGGNDILVGGLGNDILRGGLGKDKLTGGAGLDTFRLDTAPNATTNLDTIADFNLADDTMELENAIFTALSTTGALNAASFRSGAGITTAADSNDYLIYNTTTGALYYDANGSTAGAAIQIAIFTTKPLLTASDFLVV